MDAAHDDTGIGEGDSLADSLALGCQSADAEARSLLPLLLSGSTVEQLRELISVAPKIECALRAFARADPENAAFIEKREKSKV